MSSVFFEEVSPGTRTVAGPYHVTEADILTFATKWDWHPPHVDKAAAEASGYGGLIAPGVFMLAVKMNLLHRMKMTPSMIVSIGYDEVRFLQPVRPGDDLTLEVEVLEKRLSQSKPDRGIVNFRCTLRNQAGEAALTHLDTVLMRRRPG